jgi:hypothetical protein
MRKAKAVLRLSVQLQLRRCCGVPGRSWPRCAAPAAALLAVLDQFLHRVACFQTPFCRGNGLGATSDDAPTRRCSCSGLNFVRFALRSTHSSLIGAAAVSPAAPPGHALASPSQPGTQERGSAGPHRPHPIPKKVVSQKNALGCRILQKSHTYIHIVHSLSCRRSTYWVRMDLTKRLIGNLTKRANELQQKNDALLSTNPTYIFGYGRCRCM